MRHCAIMIPMNAAPTQDIILTPSFMKDVERMLEMREQAQKYFKEALQNINLPQIIKMHEEAVQQYKQAQEPFYARDFIVPAEPVRYAPVESVAVSHIATLCLDTKECELYEYDNYAHRITYSEKAKQQFKLLTLVCEAEGEYVATKDLMKHAGYSSIAATYKAVEKINHKSVRFIPGKLLEGSEGDGYRLNPNFQVHIV